MRGAQAAAGEARYTHVSPALFAGGGGWSSWRLADGGAGARGGGLAAAMRGALGQSLGVGRLEQLVAEEAGGTGARGGDEADEFGEFEEAAAAAAAAGSPAEQP